ncbi:MAG: DUF58 domain-containing protein [Verrucomicrobiales bacterium]
MPAAHDSPARSKSRFIDPATLMRIRSMELRARSVVEGFFTGRHRSPFHGFSTEFSEYRPYVPGDDPRFIDWQALARTDRVYLKKFEDETNLRCLFLVDQSRSMAFGSRGYSKADYAATLAATLAYFLSKQGDATGALAFDTAVRGYLPPGSRGGHLRRLMHLLEQPADPGAGQGGTDLTAPLERAAELSSKRGLFVLLSDLLAPLESLGTRLAYLRARGHEAVAIQILDPAEIDFDFKNAAYFHDLESADEVYADPDAAREGYQRRLNAHLAQVEAICGAQGVQYHRCRTDEPLEHGLYDFLAKRVAAAPRVARRG